MTPVMQEQSDEDLDAAIMAAHRRNEPAALARLYGKAAAEREAAGDVDAACFYYTQAYVFALSAGLNVAADFNERLAFHGRDEIQSDLRSLQEHFPPDASPIDEPGN